MQVIAGAPNIVRGGSHSGNVAASSSAGERRGRCASPPTTCRTAWWRRRSNVRSASDLPQAVALVTDRPARLAGLDDRGRLEPGQRADLVRVRLHEGLPVVRQVWRAGERVA